jgi:hypothetical protein
MEHASQLYTTPQEGQTLQGNDSAISRTTVRASDLEKKK